MANKFYVYQDDDGDNYAIQADEDLMGLYGDVTGASSPTAYADLAALQTAHPGVNLLTAGVNPRSVTLQVQGFASNSIPLLTQSDVQTALGRCIADLTASPNVANVISESHLNIIAVAFQGERRSISAP